MQVITTKYHGPTNTRGSRYSATASGKGFRVMVNANTAVSLEDNHRLAAHALMMRADWFGKVIGGHTEPGMVWVFDSLTSPIVSRPRRKAGR